MARRSARLLSFTSFQAQSSFRPARDNQLRLRSGAGDQRSLRAPSVPKLDDQLRLRSGAGRSAQPPCTTFLARRPRRRRDERSLICRAARGRRATTTSVAAGRRLGEGWTEAGRKPRCYIGPRRIERRRLDGEGTEAGRTTQPAASRSASVATETGRMARPAADRTAGVAPEIGRREAGRDGGRLDGWLGQRQIERRASRRRLDGDWAEA